MIPHKGSPPYFLGDEPALAATLDEFLFRIGRDLAAQTFDRGVAALVLGGGYGRGEGGVFRNSESGQAGLYNDLEFYVFVSDRRVAPELDAWCHRWERQGTAELGIDVEFKRLPADVFQSAASSMFYFDLLQGHRLVRGNGELLANAPGRLRDPTQIPLSEPARLLFNRGSGLLFARWKLAEQPDDADGFVERNHAKMRLALADAVLSAAGRHDGSCLERQRRITDETFAVPGGFDRLRRWHEAGVRFKLEPRHRHPGAAALEAENCELTEAWLTTFLWIESRRLGAAISTDGEYLRSSSRLFPETPRGRNILLHVRDQVRRGSALPGWTDYPRAALQRTLVAALSGGDERRAAATLGVPIDTWRDTYRHWWSFYN